MKKEEIEKLWDEYLEEPCHFNNDDKLCMDNDWYIFKKGTLLKEIDKWFRDIENDNL